MVPVPEYPILHGLFLVLVVGWMVVNGLFSLRNLRHNETKMQQNEGWLRDVIGYEDVTEVAAYLRLHTGLDLMSSLYTTALLLGVYYSGLFTQFFQWYARLNLGGTVAAGTLLVLGLVVLEEFVSLPRSLYEVFVIEEQFGFNRMNLTTFATKRLKRLLIAVPLTALLTALILGAIVRYPRVWPVLLMIGFGGFYVIMSILVPNLIQPFLHDHRPLPDGELKQRILAFLDDHDLEIGERIFVEERSDETTKANAYFAGFGSFKRLVLTDTLIDQFTGDEILGVLAHEVGHWQHNHQWKRLGSSLLGVGVQVALVYWLFGTDWLYEMWAVPREPYLGLLLAVQWTVPLSLLTGPLLNGYSRHTEREADAYAVHHSLGPALASALSGLAETNYATVFPDPLYAFFNHSHPTIPERIRATTAGS